MNQTYFLFPFYCCLVCKSWSTSSKPDTLLEDSSPNTIALGLGLPTQEFRRPTNIQPKCFIEVYMERSLPTKERGPGKETPGKGEERGQSWKGGISQQHSMGVLGPKLQSCSNVGPSNYKVLSYQWVRAASWGFVRHAKQACSKWLKSACRGYF